MGQYHLTVNLTKKEFLDPHKLGDGLKLWEQANSQGGVMVALLALLACSNGRGGGDFQDHPLIGRWAGDKIVVVGDYAEKGDAGRADMGKIYNRCRNGQEGKGPYKDISDDIMPVLEKECDVKITGDGWRKKAAIRAMKPDMVIKGK